MAQALAMNAPWWLLPLFWLGTMSGVVASSEFPNDPYLAYRPPFARSLPVQIMLTGVVLTLVAVLFVHLLFTAQYHWPLAPVNYVLQLSGVTTLLISLIATIHVVLSAAFEESEKWPYMLSYIAVNVPPLDVTSNSNSNEWSVAEKATWLVMNASTSGLIQITHIQFLTILYPSRLEGRLIFALLGPLAVVAAIMQLLPISGNPSVYTVANSIRNVCNATLSLLFTLALFIWGLLVNRKQAWRSEGGTPVFGCAALALAVISTALNFLYVHKQEEFVWLPSLMWAVVLWQSFLAWWWWVGAGAGAGGASAALAFASEKERLEEKMRVEEKKERRRREKMMKKEEKKRRKAMKKQGEATPTNAPQDSPSSPSSPRPSLHRRSSHPSASDSTPPSTASRSASASNASNASNTSNTSNTSHSSLTTIPRLLPALLYRWYTSLRRAHNAAAQLQAAEHVERMRVLGREGVVVEGVPVGVGGGIGSIGMGMGGVTHAQVVANAKTQTAVGGKGTGGQQARGKVQMGTKTRSVRLDVEVEGWGWGWEGFGWRRRRRWVVGPEQDQDEVEVEDDDDGEGEKKRRGRRAGERGLEMQDMRRRGDVTSAEEEEEDEEDEEDMYLSGAEADAREDALRRNPSLRRRTSRHSDSNLSGTTATSRRSDTPTRTPSHSNSTIQHPPPALRSPTSSIVSSSGPNPSSLAHSPSTSTPLRTQPPLAQPQTPSRAVPLPPAAPAAAPLQNPAQPQAQAPADAAAAAARPRSVWWWGPLWRWRLQDSTVYR